MSNHDSDAFISRMFARRDKEPPPCQVIYAPPPLADPGSVVTPGSYDGGYPVTVADFASYPVYLTVGPGGVAVAKVLDDTDASDKGLRAVVFAQGAFTGASQSLSPGRYDIGDLTLADDSISSVVVAKGLKVTLFEDAGFTGQWAVITSDAGSLGADLRSKVSSVVVEKA